MKEIPFSIPVSGVVWINGESVKIIVNKAETIISLQSETLPSKGTSLEPGKTLYDVILETAREVIRIKGFNRFTAPELYHKALETYSGLNRGSFMSRVVACTPNHSSYKHYISNRDYFSRIGSSFYQLNEQYRLGKAVDKERKLFNQ